MTLYKHRPGDHYASVSIDPKCCNLHWSECRCNVVTRATETVVAGPTDLSGSIFARPTPPPPPKEGTRGQEEAGPREG